ncbi:MAG TPA: polyphenol oxidase family protein [Candidatus Solibacter sp.]|jgi:YfiH family protein|nr:polyphenol oxidase family protein [Candidatus Solibacter sp.]
MTGSLQATAVIRSRLLTDAGLKHGFTTLSAGDFAWPALQTPEGRQRLKALGDEVDFDPDLMVTADQVHGSTVAVVHLCENCGPGNRVPHTDGLITEEPWPLLITTADCFPVIVYEPDAKMVAIVHCGWRGTVGGILPRAVARLIKESGGRASELRAAIGPGICGDCYEVGDDVVQAAFRAGLGSQVTADANLGRRRFDIGAALQQQLLEANLREAHVDRVGRCNFEDAELPSFRRDRTAVRSAAVVALDGPLVVAAGHRH